MTTEVPIRIATRGSPLALAQANTVAATCRAAFPHRRFEIKIVKTTGDKLQKASMAKTDPALPKGLFTKELETALLAGEADLAVHSLKDLPTDLPSGLELGAVLERADPRDVLVYRRNPVPAGRGFAPGLTLAGLPADATVATSSTRRREQVLVARPQATVVEIRGNVGTRLQKLAGQPELDATLLAAAGLARLGFIIQPGGQLTGPDTGKAGVPEGLLAAPLSPEEMLPCVGQAAIGIEVRTGDELTATLCVRLNHGDTFRCVTAERAFLHAMGGGCQSPVAAFAEVAGETLRLRGVSFRKGPAQRAELRGTPAEAAVLGEKLAALLG